MTSLAALWLPILLSAVFVFVVSSVIHMLLPWHKSEYPAVPNEDRVMDALRPLAIPPGEYMLPRANSMAAMKDPAFLEKMKRGPVMILTVLRNEMPPMGPALMWWFVYALVVSLFAAYVAGRALGPGAMYLDVFRFAGTTAFVGYALALWQMVIWYHRSLSATFKSTLDGLIYACVTAGTLGWLWPN